MTTHGMHTDRMLAYQVGRAITDGHWRCRRCGQRFHARAAARATVCPGPIRHRKANP